MQTIQPQQFAGKRLKLSAYVKSDDVRGWAGLWMRVDGPGGHRSTAFDNMKDRPIVGTSDWTRYDIVLDVAPNSEAIAYGVLLHGAGQIFLDDVSFEVVTTDVPTTGRPPPDRPPENLDFEQ
jgi:hypothetical protein